MLGLYMLGRSGGVAEDSVSGFGWTEKVEGEAVLRRDGRNSFGWVANLSW